MRRVSIPRRLALTLALAAFAAAPALAQRAAKLPRPERLDKGVAYSRDPATGDLRLLEDPSQPATPVATLHSRVSLVELPVTVRGPAGANIAGLAAASFRLLADGAPQTIAHFDAATEPASIALVLDASPSVLREFSELKDAARALASRLRPADEVAVIAFAGETHLVLPFTRDRPLLDRALDSLELLRDGPPGSRIYESVDLAARLLFRNRTGRKAILLLTDGQDSGLGLGWHNVSSPPSGDLLTFEDVCRTLASAGIETYVISPLNRPPGMTDAWLAARRDRTLLTAEVRRSGMPHYTVFLAELARRAGGAIYFIREAGRLAEVYRLIADTIGAQYTLGFYPSSRSPGWHSLRVEFAPPAPPASRLLYRPAFYLPASP